MAIEMKPYSRRARGSALFPFSHQITIASETGVGSSSTLKKMKERLGEERWQFASGGEIMRRTAARLGITIDELTRRAREQPELGYDAMCDAETQKFGERNYTVLESRLGHVFLTHSFRVKLVCDVKIRAKRRHADLVRAGNNITYEQVLQDIIDRDANDNVRYEALYPGCIWPESDFDLVLDTGELNPDEIVNAILEAHAVWHNDTKPSPP